MSVATTAGRRSASPTSTWEIESRRLAGRAGGGGALSYTDTGGDRAGLGKIIDDEPRLAIEPGVLELWKDKRMRTTAQVSLTVSLSEAAVSEVSVDWATGPRSDVAGIPAEAGQDYTARRRAR